MSRMGGAIVGEGVWITSASDVDGSAPSEGSNQSDTFSPRVVHMSDTPVTLRERCLCAPFHRTYYNRSWSTTSSRGIRGWTP